MEEFKQLYNFDYKNNTKLEKARDLYCFGCLTALRYSDIISLKYEHLTETHIRKRIVKTKETLSIPILPQASKIIEKYKNNTIYVLPQLSNVKLNAYIKECCMVAGIDTPTLKQSYKGNKTTETAHPKYKLITAHTSRKTFITIAYLNGLDIPTIMAITGHKSYNMLKRYLKENADKIKRDLEKAWNF
jgi:integrase